MGGPENRVPCRRVRRRYQAGSSKRSRRLALAAVALLGCAVSATLFLFFGAGDAMIAAQFKFDAQLRINAIERNWPPFPPLTLWSLLCRFAER